MAILEQERALLRQKISAEISSQVEAEGSSYKTSFGTPLAGFLAANDSRVALLKEFAHPDHFEPKDLMPDAKAVVVYFLPFSKDLAMNNKAKAPTTKAWAVAYKEANALLALVGERLIQMLSGMGIKGTGVKPTHNFDEETLLANWSHRHLAWLAGMGEFGLNRMLITEKGCAGRYGSIVIDREIIGPKENIEVTKPAAQPTVSHKGKASQAADHPCLYFRNGSCQICVKNCPSKALTVDGFDRHKCYDYMLDHCRDRFADLGVTDVCGKCLATPCAFKQQDARSQKPDEIMKYFP